MDVTCPKYINQTVIREECHKSVMGVSAKIEVMID